MSEPPSWAVVATVDEPPAVVEAYVAWHLQIGAAEVFLYFDRPDDPAADLFDHLDRVHVRRCDAAHWARLGRSRPHRHQVRQARNATDAYANTTAAWLLHSDADEFLWSAAAVADVLARAPIGADCVVAPVAERVHFAGDDPSHIFAGSFRLPFTGASGTARKAFGAQYDLTYRGMTGHAQGKAFSKTGGDLRLSIHRPKPAKDRALSVHRPGPDELVLLHFEGLTRAQWIFKLRRMAKALDTDDGMPPTPHRARQMMALAEDPKGAEALHDLLKVCDPAGLATLAAHDLLLTPGFDPRPALATYFPDAVVDLSMAGVDRWLAQNKAATLRFIAE